MRKLLTALVLISSCLGVGLPASALQSINVIPQEPTNVFGPQEPIKVFGPQEPIKVFGPQEPTRVFGPQEPIKVFGPQEPTVPSIKLQGTSFVAFNQQSFNVGSESFTIKAPKVKVLVINGTVSGGSESEGTNES